MPIEISLLTTLLKGRTNREEEAQVIELLRSASAKDLDETLIVIDAAELFTSVDDRLIGPDHRTELRELMMQRLGDLSIPAQANLAYGLQSHHTDVADERAIEQIFLSRHGLELTQLKNQINSRLDNHDLEGLIFKDVDNREIRTEILLHIAREAATVEITDIKVLCDIDDTVLCALHDKRYPKGIIYPGILALLEALDRGPEDQPISMGDLTFVTARPGDAFGLIENHTRTTLRGAGIATHSVLTGTLSSLVTHDLMAGRKVANIEHYRQLFPEYRKMFIGDSGQGDVKVGQLLLQRFGDVIDAIVIHDVVGTSAEERAKYERQGITFVDTYVEAAQFLFAKQMISQDGLDEVIAESRAALDEIPWSSEEQRANISELIEQAVQAGSPDVEPGTSAIQH